MVSTAPRRHTSHPKSKPELLNAIKRAIKRAGPCCDLNHIDVSAIADFSEVFLESPFNGDISQWNTSSATTMHRMFESSQFNGNIADWDVSTVTDMKQMFGLGQFNGDLSKWDVSSVREFKQIFYNMPFEGDISMWAIHPDAVIFTMYGLEQTRTAKHATLLHWRLAEVNLDNISPIMQAHYLKHAELVKSMVSDPVERAYWIHDQWRQVQAHGPVPADPYTVTPELFENAP